MLFEYAGYQRAILRKVDDFGFLTYDLVGLPRRICEVDPQPLLLEPNVDKRRVRELTSPATALVQALLAEGDNWLAQTSRTLARLYAAFLIAEDPQRRLDARKAATLMHQVSLVQHILQRPELRKVLIGDEVGLGKTIEAGLLVRQLMERSPHLRVLYLAPARLVRNVAREFREKLDIDARIWVAGSASDARLPDDQVIVASINKAVFGRNVEQVVSGGPWDVLIVDECHHLSDWDPTGGKPNQSYRLVSQLVKEQPADGRLILMSGTPHQGSEARFRNVLRLLSDDGKDIKSSAGRVIFRTKDRVRDWRGAPLFPSREIRQPIVVELGERYARWYARVGSLYAGGSSGRLRAAGWARGQALQWAASSVQAGLGFLARLAIRRLNWTLDQPSLCSALSALRPYRGGSRDEPLRCVFDRLLKQIGNGVLEQLSLEDEEESGDEEWRPDPHLLAELLHEGVELVLGGADRAKWDALCALIDKAGSEKVVLFAQPVETVTVVADVLERRYGVRPAMIIGNQTDDERTRQVASFQSDDGPRFLVSSKAGGEGLNMQRARRLVHLDVPWNPMDLEQRIGRVHRFGSRKTIVVDTVVAAGSREIDMYRIAREKLALVARHLDPEQFDALFSRVMSLVPPKELENILGDLDSGPLSQDGPATEEIGRLVTEGFRSWSSFDETYRRQAELIRAADPGQAHWADLAAFLVKHGGATDSGEATFSSFAFSDEEIVDVEERVPAIRFADGLFACGDTGGLLATGSDGSQTSSLGINLDWVQRILRASFASDKSATNAFVKWPLGFSLGVLQRETLTCLFFLRQQLRQESGRWLEGPVEFKAYAIANVGTPIELDAMTRAHLVRALQGATRLKDPSEVLKRSDLTEIESQLFMQLRVPSDQEITDGVRYSIWPIAAVTIVP